MIEQIGGLVTQYDHYLKFLDLLNSNVWNERSRATVELKKINDAEVLYKLFKVIEDRNVCKIYV